MITTAADSTLKRASSSRRIERIPRDGASFLTFFNELLLKNVWFKANEGQTIPAHFRVTGEVNNSALEQAMTEAARRHEVLRSRFAVTGEGPRQTVEEMISAPLVEVDLRGLPDDARAVCLGAILTEEHRRLFDLAADLLWRVVSIRPAENDQIVILTVDHMIADERSMSVLIGDLWLLYFAFAMGEPSPLREPAVQLLDFAAWQRGFLQGKSLERLTSYWERDLEGKGALPEFHIPGENPLPCDCSYRPFAAVNRELAPRFRGLLDRIAQSNGATLQMVIFSAIAILLRGYSGDDDVCFRFVSSKRHRLETMDLIGWLSDLLVLRVKVFGEDSFPQLLARVRSKTLAAYDHQDLPYMLFPGYDGKLARGIFKHPSLTVNLALDAVSSSSEAADAAMRKLGLAIAPVKPPPRAQIREPGMSLAVGPRGGGLNLVIKYEVERYSEPAADRFLADFVAVLRAIAERPAGRISDLRLNPADLSVTWPTGAALQSS